MELSPELTRLAWVAGGFAAVSLIGLVVGLSLLLGTMRHRTIGLPLVWIFAALLFASGTALVLLLTQR